MVTDARFVWLHFPKCAGTETTQALQKIGGYVRAKETGEVRHDTVPARAARDPSFSLGDRPIIANFRRLPYWMLSRVHYEYERSGHAPTRKMMVGGWYRHLDGSKHFADHAIG